VGGDRDIKFGRHVDSSKSKPADDRSSLKGAMVRSRKPFKIWWESRYLWNDCSLQLSHGRGHAESRDSFFNFCPNDIFGIFEATHFKFHVLVDT